VFYTRPNNSFMQLNAWLRGQERFLHFGGIGTLFESRWVTTVFAVVLGEDKLVFSMLCKCYISHCPLSEIWFMYVHDISKLPAQYSSTEATIMTDIYRIVNSFNMLSRSWISCLVEYVHSTCLPFSVPGWLCKLSPTDCVPICSSVFWSLIFKYGL
jgi:hypothetical protein